MSQPSVLRRWCAPLGRGSCLGQGAGRGRLVRVLLVPVVACGLLAAPGLVLPASAGVRAAAFQPCEGFEQVSLLGSPRRTVAGLAQAGSAYARFSWAGSAEITGSSLGLADAAGARFANSTAVANLNSADQCPDAVIGVPGADGGRGRVVLVAGSAEGFTAARTLTLDASVLGLQPGDKLGEAVTAIRVTNGVLVAAGLPGRDLPGVPDAGAVATWFIPFGGVEGEIQAAVPPSLWVQGASGLPGHSDANDHFGAVLAPADQGTTDVLTIGVPDEDIGSAVDAGAVVRLTFSDATLASASMLWQGSGLPGQSKKGDRLGAAVNSSPVAFGLPGKDSNGRRDSGAVIVYDGAAKYVLITQNTPGVPDRSEKGDRFGAALASVFGAREHEVTSLAVGVPGEDAPGRRDAGAVTYIEVELGLRFGQQAAAGLRKGDKFGSSLEVALGDTDLDEDMRDILLVGAPGSDFPGAANAGRFWQAETAGISPGVFGGAGSQPGQRLGE